MVSTISFQVKNAEENNYIEKLSQREPNSKYNFNTCIAGGSDYTVGLRTNNTVIAVGNNEKGQCNTGDWRDIIALAAGGGHTVGLKADGTVIATGNNEYGQCNTGKWCDIVAISAGFTHTVGLKADGTTIAVGENKDGKCNIGDWCDIVAIATGFAHTVGLKINGTVIAVGNNVGQCNTSEWSNITAISAGGSHTVGLKTDGTVVAVGINRHGQCNTGDWSDIVGVSAGGSYTVGLKADGTVIAVGNNEDGQCNISGWRNISAIVTGFAHTVGLKTDCTIVAVGDNSKGQCDTNNWRNIGTVFSKQILKQRRQKIYDLGNIRSFSVSDWWQRISRRAKTALIVVAVGIFVGGVIFFSDWVVSRKISMPANKVSVPNITHIVNTTPEQQNTQNSVTSPAPVQKTATLNGNFVNIRSEPYIASSIQHQGNNGDRVDVLSKSQVNSDELWYLVEYQLGKEGWVHSNFLNIADHIAKTLKTVSPPPPPPSLPTSKPTPTTRLQNIQRVPLSDPAPQPATEKTPPQGYKTWEEYYDAVAKDTRKVYDALVEEGERKKKQGK